MTTQQPKLHLSVLLRMSKVRPWGQKVIQGAVEVKPVLL